MELIGEAIENKFDGSSIAESRMGNRPLKENRSTGSFMKKGLACNPFWKMKAIQNNLHQGDHGPIEIYDLYHDPGESLDLSQSHPHLVDKAKKFLSQHPIGTLFLGLPTNSRKPKCLKIKNKA